MGISGLDEKMNGLAKANLVQQGAELAYLLRHDPEFRSLRREHLIEAGKQVRLKIMSISWQISSRKVSIDIVSSLM